MKTHILLAALFSGIFSLNQAKAQYNNLLQKQKPDEIIRLKTQKVAKQAIFIEVNGNQGPYGINFFDEQGRIISSITPKNHQHFSYDANGRLINWIDSAHDGRRFFKNEYNFTFDAAGMPSQFKLQKNASAFTYNAAKKELTETINGTGSRVYIFNDENKLQEATYTENGKITKHKLLYNKYGDLASEIQSTEDENGYDSLSTIYSYDSKGRLLRKQVISKKSVNESEDPTNPPTITKTSETYTYTYDIRSGLLVGENLVSNAPGKNQRMEWTYDNNGLLLKEAKYDGANKPLQIFVYKYYYDRR